MIILWITVVGMCGLCSSACSLADYLAAMEREDSSCGSCSDKADCFAIKRNSIFRYDMLNTWMLVTFFTVRHQCRHAVMKWDGRAVMCGISAFFVFLSLFWSKGFGMEGALYGIAGMALLCLSVVDWCTQYIPLEMSGVIFVCGLIQLFADLSNWLEYAIGLIAVGGFLYIVNLVGTPILKKRYEGEQEIDSVIGDGDIKLMAATGLLLGWKLNFLALGIGCIAGSVIHLVLMQIKKGERQFALGPYLSLGVYITMICGEQLVSWYLSMMGVMPVN